MKRLALILLLSLFPGLTYAQRVQINNTVPDFSASTTSPYTLTVNGSGFVSGSTIYWGSIALSTTFVSAYQLTTTVPCCLSQGISTVPISVVNPGGLTSVQFLFKNLGDNAPVSSMTPADFTEGQTTALTVNGNYFLDGSQIYFDNLPQTSTFVSQFQMTATVPGVDIDGRHTHTVKVHYPKNSSTVRFTPALINFGTVSVGSSTLLSSTMSNLAGTILNISSIVRTGDGSFSETHTCGATVAPYANCEFDVTFAPTMTGTLTGQITVTDSGVGSPHILSLSGVVTGPTGPVASFSPNSLSFGSVPVSTPSSPQTTTLTNTGGTSLTITSVALAGTDAGNYGIVDGCTSASPLAPSASCNVDATCTPLSAGAKNSANITFTDSAVDSPQQVPLSCTGTSTHYVDLAWTASTSSGITGYNVYRGTVSGGPYVQINGALIPGVAYTDFAVTSGGHYCYVVTAYGPSGFSPNESVYSGESCATVP